MQRHENELLDFADPKRYVTDSYLKPSLILDTFMNSKYRSEPKFKLQGPPLTIKHVSYNHLQQKVIVRNLPQTLRDEPKLMSFKENKVLIREWYPYIVIGDNAPEWNMTLGNLAATGKRRKCDMCIETDPRRIPGDSLLCPSRADRGDPECGDFESCNFCAQLRRPCTWTPTARLMVAHTSGHTGREPTADKFQEKLTIGKRQAEEWEIEVPTHYDGGIERSPDTEDD